MGVDPYNPSADIKAGVGNLPFEDDFADVVLCTQVLEHLREPTLLFSEAFRILRNNGFLVLVTPQTFDLHEEPRDFYRFTKYGLHHMAEKHGFKVIEIRPLGGAMKSLIVQTIAVICNLPLPLRVVLWPLVVFFNLTGDPLDSILYSPKNTWTNLMIAQKDLAKTPPRRD